MIMELSKQTGVRAPDPKRTFIREPFHQSVTPVDASVLDMEKYLKLAEVSSGESDASGSHSCLDVLSQTADSMVNAAAAETSRRSADAVTEVRRSSIPRPKSSGLRTSAAAHPSRKSTASTRSSVKPVPAKSPEPALKTGAAYPLVSKTSPSLKGNGSVPSLKTSPGFRGAGRKASPHGPRSKSSAPGVREETPALRSPRVSAGKQTPQDAFGKDLFCTCIGLRTSGPLLVTPGDVTSRGRHTPTVNSFNKNYLSFFCTHTVLVGACYLLYFKCYLSYMF